MMKILKMMIAKMQQRRERKLRKAQCMYACAYGLQIEKHTERSRKDGL